MRLALVLRGDIQVNMDIHEVNEWHQHCGNVSKTPGSLWVHLHSRKNDLSLAAYLETGTILLLRKLNPSCTKFIANLFSNDLRYLGLENDFEVRSSQDIVCEVGGFRGHPSTVLVDIGH